MTPMTPITPSPRRSRPPGPPPVTKHPWSILRYASLMRNGGIDIVGRRFAEYGDLYFAPFLDRGVYVMRHPDHIREVLLTQANRFQKPETGLTARTLRRLLGDGLLNSNGETWRAHRRLVQPAFGPGPIARYADDMTEYARVAVDSWRDGATLDVSREMMELTLRIVAKTLFDHRVTSETDRVADVMRVFRSSVGGVDSVLPDWLPTPARRRSIRALADIDALVFDLIDARRGRPPGSDLLSVLVGSPGDAEVETDARLDRRALRDEVLTLFLAGHETTSHALSWTLHLLADHPEVESQLHAEVDRVLGGRTPTLDDLPNLPLVERVLSESMRLYPPAYVIPRVSTEESEIGGYVIPAGSDVVMWIYHTHRHPDVHVDPLRFDPDRFLPERVRALPSCAYLPFGAGSRTCIGKRFAIVEAQLLLATIVQSVTLRRANAQPVRADANVTLAPKGGLPMVVARRRTSHAS